MATFSELVTEVRRYASLGTRALDTETAQSWSQSSLRMINRAAPWPWLETAFTFTLVADQYAYPLRTTLPTLSRFDTRSVRLANQSEALTWTSLTEVQRLLGRGWRTDTGEPEYIFRQGPELWVAPVPSNASAATYPTVCGYGWQMENISGASTVNEGHLLLPDGYFEVAVKCALAYGYPEKDDDRSEVMFRYFRQVAYPDMLTPLDIGGLDFMELPYIHDGQAAKRRVTTFSTSRYPITFEGGEVSYEGEDIHWVDG